jgi:hypothetical protein
MDMERSTYLVMRERKFEEFILLEISHGKAGAWTQTISMSHVRFGVHNRPKLIDAAGPLSARIGSRGS